MGKILFLPYRIVSFSYKIHQETSALAWDHFSAGGVP
jgi:hypothetical protein